MSAVRKNIPTKTPCHHHGRRPETSALVPKKCPVTGPETDTQRDPGPGEPPAPGAEAFSKKNTKNPSLSKAD